MAETCCWYDSQAFEKLAHPEYGIMMVKYRPVDCNNHKPMQFDPGYISDKIYDVSSAPQTRQGLRA